MRGLAVRSAGQAGRKTSFSSNFPRDSDIQAECKAKVNESGQIATGDCEITGSGNLIIRGIRFIIHAVGPIWEEGLSGEDQLLRDCVRSILTKFTSSHRITSISIPPVSIGLFGFPKSLCASITVDTVLEEVLRPPANSIEEIRLVTADEEMLRLFQAALESKVDQKTMNEEQRDCGLDGENPKQKARENSNCSCLLI